MIFDLIDFRIPYCDILIIGNIIFYRDQETLQPVLAKKCLFLGKPMRVYKSRFILLLKPPNIYLKRGSNLCQQNVFVRTYLKSILDVNGVRVEETTIQQFFSLAVMIILFVCKGQLLILQEIQEVNIKIKEPPPGMILATSFFQKEKRNNYTLATYIYIRR